MLVKPDNKIFNSIIKEVDITDFEEKRKCKAAIKEMEKYLGSALGISANQLGLDSRVFLLRGEKTAAIINPSVVWESSNLEEGEEGCLTFPGLYVKIKRPDEIGVKYINYQWEEVETTLAGLTARCYLHEMDHLNGVNYLSRSNKFHVDQRKRKLKLARRKNKELDKALKEMYKPSPIVEEPNQTMFSINTEEQLKRNLS